MYWSVYGACIITNVGTTNMLTHTQTHTNIHTGHTSGQPDIATNERGASFMLIRMRTRTVRINTQTSSEYSTKNNLLIHTIDGHSRD